MSKIVLKSNLLVRDIPLREECGATIVEFALAILAFMMLLGLIVDGGIAIWRYSALTETINLVTVDRSIHLTQPWGLAGPNEFNVTDCISPGGCSTGTLENCAKELVLARLQSFTKVNDANMIVRINDFPTNIRDRLVIPLSITATWDADCYFCGLIGMSSFQISATGETIVEAAPSTVEARCSDVNLT